ncbi:helix-turn-helix transcriptional regulator [Actinokineospora soli]|uniref:Helix-turn-helix transcriptional regulator n=1 Tax=Actinokineospora soli TaxID=1048753 RepID=A0ABW2TQS2_9PSEU
MTENLGDVLVAFRARSGLSQQELAERAGLSVRAVRDIERGRVRAPHARSLRRLADVVGLDLASNRLRADVVRVDVLGPLVVRRGSTSSRCSRRCSAGCWDCWR